MRVPNRTDVAVCQSIMGLPGASVGVHVKTTALPRRTFQASRSRILLREWVQRRMVPNFISLGLPIASFVLCRPYAENCRRIQGLWGHETSNALTWASPETLFGVFFSADWRSAQRLAGAIAPEASLLERIILHADIRDSSVPVYFDFEGLWAKLYGRPGLFGYPTPLDWSRELESAVSPVLLQSRRQRVLDAIGSARSEGDDSARAPLIAIGSERRKLSRFGLIRPRVFLDPVSVSRTLSGFPDGLAFVSGRLRSDCSYEALFRILIDDCDIIPFLFACSEGQVLVGSMYRRAAASDAAVRERPASRIAMLSACLTTIAVLREPFDGLTVPVNHRYDRPLEQDDTLNGTQ
jgi:hypothetical protein